MSYLQTVLDEIEARAAKESALACANAALIDLAADICQRINAAGEGDTCQICWHLNDHRPSATLMADRYATDDELLDAAEAAGFALAGLPARVCRDAAGKVDCVYLMIAPAVELRVMPLPNRMPAVVALPEAA